MRCPVGLARTVAALHPRTLARSQVGICPLQHQEVGGVPRGKHELGTNQGNVWHHSHSIHLEMYHENGVLERQYMYVHCQCKDKPGLILGLQLASDHVRFRAGMSLWYFHSTLSRKPEVWPRLTLAASCKSRTVLRCGCTITDTRLMLAITDFPVHAGSTC